MVDRREPLLILHPTGTSFIHLEYPFSPPAHMTIREGIIFKAFKAFDLNLLIIRCIQDIDFNLCGRFVERMRMKDCQARPIYMCGQDSATVD